MGWKQDVYFVGVSVWLPLTFPVTSRKHPLHFCHWSTNLYRKDLWCHTSRKLFVNRKTHSYWENCKKWTFKIHFLIQRVMLLPSLWRGKGRSVLMRRDPNKTQPGRSRWQQRWDMKWLTQTVLPLSFNISGSVVDAVRRIGGDYCNQPKPLCSSPWLGVTSSPSIQWQIRQQPDPWDDSDKRKKERYDKEKGKEKNITSRFRRTKVL